MHNGPVARSSWGSLERRGASWDARWRDPVTKKPRRKRVGGVAELGEKLDEAARDRILREVRSRVECVPGITFAAFLDAYEHVYRLRVARSTFETTYPQMRRVAALLPRSMESVTEGDAETVVAAMGLGPRSTRTLVVRLRSFWRAAGRRGAVTGNPWLGFSLPAVKRRLARVLTADGLRAVVAAAPDDLKALVRVLGECGLRIGEAAAVTWEDVEADCIVVRVSKSEPRRVKITPAVREALSVLPVPVRRTNPVFPSIRTPGLKRYALKRFLAALEAAGIPPMRFHDLRHTTGYRMARANVKTKLIAHALGITEQTAKVYSDHDPEELGGLAFDLMLRHERLERETRERAGG